MTDPLLRIKAIQGILGVDQDGIPGPVTEKAWQELKRSRVPVVVWPFTAKVVGNDLIVENVAITCFGGWGNGNISDPNDSGATASGISTKYREVEGVALPMDGRMFSRLSSAEHKALDGSPIPRLVNERGLTAWHTPVEITIDGYTYTPKDGVIDLGPGRQATRKGEPPNACDLTPIAASHWSSLSLRKLATQFYKIGSYRIIGGAKLGGLI
jgi:hypothetical protein